MHHSGGTWTKIRLSALILSSAWLIAAGCFSVLAVSNGDVVIDRFQITGGTGLSDNDFVTIYNRSDQPVDISGWRIVKRTKTGTADTTLATIPAATNLAAHASYTWANSSNGFAASLNANIWSTQTLSADNAVALRSGPENTGAIIDSVGWGTAANVFVETAPYPSNPAGNEIIERLNHADTNNNSTDFKPAGYVPGPTCGNGQFETNEECDDGNTNAGDGCSASCQLEAVGSQAVEVVINEFVSDPISGEEEWVELYNAADSVINMSDWTLEDGGGTKTTFSGSIPAHGFLVHKPGGSLNNAGDAIILRNASGGLLDSVAYGDWDDGSLNDNAPAAADPASVARAIDGSGNFVLTTTPTKGTANNITAPDPEKDEEETSSSSDLIITEAFINPPGIDSEAKAEFIELYNRGESAVPLKGWRMIVDSFVYEFDDEKSLEAGEYLELSYRLGFKLINSGGTIKLLAPGKSTAVQTITYKEAPDGASYMLAYEDKKHLTSVWSWTFTPTPEAANESVREPKAAFSTSRDLSVQTPIQFDSSDTDNGETALSFHWDFGDGTSSLLEHPEHTFVKKGTYPVTLTVQSPYGTSAVTKKITVASPGPEMSETEKKAAVLRNDIVISEIFPNPAGADGSQEWIEVENTGTEPVDLNGWEVVLKSKKKIIEGEFEVPAGGFKILDADVLPGALGNTSESISLLAPDGSATAPAAYSDAPEGQSYAFDGKNWSWTETPTPGDRNSITRTEKKPSSTEKKAVDGVKTLTGIVATLPGTFSSQSFYIRTAASETLEQVYNSKKLFPSLKLGDTVSVTGEASMTQTGPRLKTETAGDITITGTSSLPVPEPSTTSELSTGSHPRLAVIEGEIASKKSPRLTLVDAQGEAAIYLAAGSGVSISTFKVGDTVRVTGITQSDSAGYRLQPRSKDDIVFLSPSTAPTATATPEAVEQAFGQTDRNHKNELLKYILLACALIAGGVGYFLWKQKQK